MPYISEFELSFSIVHHIRAEKGGFVGAGGDACENAGDNREHMFAFICGSDCLEIRNLLTRTVERWQDIIDDHPHQNGGITPRLFLAVLLLHYGCIISEKIRKVYKCLKIFDCALQEEMHRLSKDIESLSKELPEHFNQKTRRIHDINQELIDMNRKLTGIQSTMHYLTASADALVKDITPFEKQIKAQLHEWRPEGKQLIRDLQKMDSCRKQVRDYDKLVIVKEVMLQHRRDIEALEQHININVGMVSLD